MYCATRLFISALSVVAKVCKHVALGAGKRSLVARLLLALERAPRFGRVIACVNRHDGLLVGEEDPVAIFFGQFAPGAIDVVAKAYQDVALVLPSPRGRPCGDGALTNGKRVVRHHRLLGDFIYAPKPVALGAGTLRGIGRKRLCIKKRLIARIIPCARVQHAQQVGQRGDAAHG